MVLPSILGIVDTAALGIALAIAAIIPALGWGLSSFLNSAELKAWSKKEFSEFVASVFIIAALIVILPLIDIALQTWNFTPAYALPGQVVTRVTYFDTAHAPHSPIYIENARAHLSQMYYLIYGTAYDFAYEAAFYSVISGIKIDIGEIIVQIAGASTGGTASLPLKLLKILANISLTIQPFKPLAHITAVLSDAVKTCFDAFMLIVGQIALLDFIEAMMPVVLPLGLIFRAFPLTRKTGSTLIALTLVAYIIYPLSLNVGGVMYDQSKFLVDQTKSLKLKQISDVGGHVSPVEMPPLLSREEAKTTAAEWYVYGNVTYRLWHSINDKCTHENIGQNKVWSCVCLLKDTGMLCDTCREGQPDAFYLGGHKELQQPPMNPSNLDEYTVWKIAYVETMGSVPSDYFCYEMIRNGTHEGEMAIYSFPLSTINWYAYENKTHAFMLDVYARNSTGDYNPAGISETRVFIGDPGSSEWTSAEERMGKIAEVGKVSSTQSEKTFVSSLFTMIGNVAEDASQLQSGSTFDKLTLLANPPKLAAIIYLSWTERIPRMMVPIVIVLFTIVISIIFTVTAFKGISPAIGGEADIAGLGKLI